jgi:hypothetical protein
VAKVLPGQEFVETTGAKLVHEGVGGIKKLVEHVLAAGGGSIFVDEAYQLTPANPNGSSSAGSGVMDYLLTEMENNIGQIIFIFAGYNKVRSNRV